MDQHVPLAITEGLRARGVDVLTCYEDGTSELDDTSLLRRATELGRVLFTQDADFLSVMMLVTSLFPIGKKRIDPFTREIVQPQPSVNKPTAQMAHETQ